MRLIRPLSTVATWTADELGELRQASPDGSPTATLSGPLVVPAGDVAPGLADPAGAGTLVATGELDTAAPREVLVEAADPGVAASAPEAAQPESSAATATRPVPRSAGAEEREVRHDVTRAV
jgi:hypothetical protein